MCFSAARHLPPGTIDQLFRWARFLPDWCGRPTEPKEAAPTYVDTEGEEHDEVTSTTVWGPFPAGTYTFGFDCNEGDFTLRWEYEVL